MTLAKTRAQLRRLDDLSSIQRVIASLCAPARGHGIGLQAMADLCAKRAGARAGRDCHAVRDQLLTIACEWDLARDRLEEQSDDCLAAIAAVLRS